jgi:flagellar assembly protein FliH
MSEHRVLRAYRLQTPKVVVGNRLSSNTVESDEHLNSSNLPADLQAPAKTSSQEEAYRILREARQEAEEIRRQAQERGYRQGYEEGLRAGKQAGESVIAAEVQRIREIAESAQAARLRLLDSLEGEIVELVLAVARKIIGDELSQNPDAIVSIVRQASAQLADAKPLRVRLHPRDAQRLADFWLRGERATSEDQHWELISDERVSPGGCIIEAGAGTVDARIETQMSEVARAFRELAGTA